MPVTSEDGVGGSAQELAFVAATWAAGVANQITIVGQGVVPGVGQIGPHRFPDNRLYIVQVYEDLGGNIFDQVDVAIQINRVTGAIQLDKAPAAPDFPGRVLIEGPR